MPSKPLHLYALAMQGWVEIRLAARMPRIQSSTVKIKAFVRPNVYTRTGRRSKQYVHKDLDLDINVFSGGKVLGHMEHYTFTRIVQRHLFTADRYRIPPHYCPAIYAYLEERRMS